MIVNCSTPKQRKRFTIIFERYSAIPNGQEFQAGEIYYYISKYASFLYLRCFTDIAIDNNIYML